MGVKFSLLTWDQALFIIIIIFAYLAREEKK